MNAGHSAGCEAQRRDRHGDGDHECAGGTEDEQARRERLVGLEASDHEAPVGLAGGLHHEHSNEPSEERDGDGRHVRAVNVAHGGQDLAAAGQPDPARQLLRLRDCASDEEEGQRDEQYDEQRAARLLAEAEPVATATRLTSCSSLSR